MALSSTASTAYVEFDAPAPSRAPASLVMTGLEQARSVVEQRFLAAGEVLGFAVSGVGQLIGALDKLATALDTETVAATRAELDHAAQNLLGLRDRLELRRGRTRALGRVVDRLRGGIENMRRDLAYLRVFALNIKVTAAGIPGAGADFAVFAQEISDRIEAGRLELEGFAAQVEVLHRQLQAALAQEQALAGECERLIPAVPNGLAASADEIAAHHERVAKVATEVRGLAQNIQRQVGAALGALQVGDSTRQRIEHVQLGLRQLAAHGGDAPLAAAVHPLLAAQLGAAAADFNRDAAQIQQSMAGIAGDAAELLRLRDLAFGGSAAGGGFLDRMTLHLGQALGLVDRMEAADAAAATTGSAAVDAVEALSRRIAILQSIKTDVQQMALNTTLKCARIGDPGKPLSVIAIELRNHAGLLEGSARHAQDALETLAADAGEMLQQRTVDAAGAALTAATARLRNANAEVEAELAALAEQGEAVVRALGEAAAQLDFHGEIGGALEAAAATLDAGADDVAQEPDAEVLGQILQAIAKAYTMAQEREVHAALVVGLTPEPVAAATEAEDELDAVLF